LRCSTLEEKALAVGHARGVGFAVHKLGVKLAAEKVYLGDGAGRGSVFLACDFFQDCDELCGGSGCGGSVGVGEFSRKGKCVVHVEVAESRYTSDPPTREPSI
jgi:hypothetical protein